MWLLPTSPAEDGEAIHLSQGETTVVVGREAFDDAAQLWHLLLPDIPSSVIVLLLTDDDDGSVKVLNLSTTICVWAQGEPLSCHGVATLREGDDVCIHSLRYSFRVSNTSSSFSSGMANSSSSLIPDHALEVGELKTWFAFFGLLPPTTETTLSTEDGRLLTAVSYEMESAHRQGHFLSFETVIEKTHQEACLAELCSIAEIAACAIAFLQRCSAAQHDSDLADAMTAMSQQESFLRQGKSKRLSLARILALSLRSMPEQSGSSQLLLQELILPLYPMASRRNLEEIAQSLAQLLAVEDGEETETVVQVLLLMLIRRLFPPAGGVPRSRGPAEELPGLIDDVKDVLAWLRQRDAPVVEEKSRDKQHQSPTSVVELSPVAQPSNRGPKPLARLHLPQPDPPQSLAAQLHENRHVLKILFSTYNAMQRGRERTKSPSSPKRVFLLNQEMSLATLRLLLRDFGLEPFSALENLRALVMSVKKARVGGSNSGSPVKLSPTRRPLLREEKDRASVQPRPSFWSPTRSSAAKLAQRSPSSPRSSPPPRPVFSWGPSVSFEELEKILLSLGEIKAVMDRPGGLIGIINASKAAKRLGLRSAELFSVRPLPVPRQHSPSRSPRPASTPSSSHTSPTFSSSFSSSSSSSSTRRTSMSQSLKEIRRALF